MADIFATRHRTRRTALTVVLLAAALVTLAAFLGLDRPAGPSTSAIGGQPTATQSAPQAVVRSLPDLGTATVEVTVVASTAGSSVSVLCSGSVRSAGHADATAALVSLWVRTHNGELFEVTAWTDMHGSTTIVGRTPSHQQISHRSNSKAQTAEHSHTSPPDLFAFIHPHSFAVKGFPMPRSSLRVAAASCFAVLTLGLAACGAPTAAPSAAPSAASSSAKVMLSNISGTTTGDAMAMTNTATQATWKKLPLTDSQGKTFTIGDLAGRPVYLQFFATWCPGCRGQLVKANAAGQQTGSKAVFLALSVETDLAASNMATYQSDNKFPAVRFAVMSPAMLAAVVACLGNNAANPPAHLTS